MELLVDLMPAGTTVLVLDPERARSRAHDLVATSEEFLGASWAAAAGGGIAPIDLGAASYREIADVRLHALGLGHTWWSVSPFGIDSAARRTPTWAAEPALPTHAAEAYRGDLEQAIEDIRGWLARACDVTVVHAGHGPAERFVELLGEHDIAARLVEEGDTAGAGVVTVTCGHLVHGVVDTEARVAIITGDDLSGQKASTRDMRKMPARRKRQIDPLELKAGDYVVHEQHGVGRFVEMKQREVGGATREYLVLDYGASKRGGPGGQALRPGRQPRPGHPLRRWREPEPGPPRRR